MISRLIVIGSDRAGRDIATRVIAAVPEGAPIAVVWVEASNPATANGESALAALFAASRVSVCEVADKDPIVGGRAYVPPPDYHLLVEHGTFALAIDEPIGGARPAIAPLVTSALEAYGGAICAVVVGNLDDETHATLRGIREAGGAAFAIDGNDATDIAPFRDWLASMLLLTAEHV